MEWTDLGRPGSSASIVDGDRNPKYLFDSWPSVERRLRHSKRLALFLDFDGTLARLRRRPEKVRLSKTNRRLLRDLARHPRVTVCVISGRRRADVLRRVGLRGVHYLGLHGWERGDGRRVPAAVVKWIRKAHRKLEARLRGYPGIWIEDKEFSFVVHTRGTSLEAAHRAKEVVHEVLGALAPDARVLQGKGALEVLPRHVQGKGAAALRFLGELKSRALPVFVGDDSTDEAAFVALPGGITVRVGRSSHTRAAYFLKRRGEVRKFLEELVKTVA